MGFLLFRGRVHGPNSGRGDPELLAQGGPELLVQPGWGQGWLELGQPGWGRG